MVNLPISIEVVVLQVAAQQTGMPQSIFQVVSAAPRVWSRSNLGLNFYRAGHSGDRFLIPGWSVQVTDGLHHWLYRVDTAGRTVRFDPTAQTLSASNRTVGAEDRTPMSMGTRNTCGVAASSVVTSSASINSASASSAGTNGASINGATRNQMNGARTGKSIAKV